MKNKESHLHLSDDAFCKQIERCTLDAGTFTHEAHVRLAWIQINTFGLEHAKENIQTQLLNFVEHAGAKEKYHSTLTVAAVEVVNRFIRQSNSTTFEEFIEEFPELIYNFRDLINRHYSFDIFTSKKAKLTYVKADVLPFE